MVAPWSSTNSEPGLCGFVQHLMLSGPLTPNPPSMCLRLKRALHRHPLSSCRHRPLLPSTSSLALIASLQLKALVWSPRSFEPLFPFKSDRNRR